MKLLIHKWAMIRINRQVNMQTLLHFTMQFLSTAAMVSPDGKYFFFMRRTETQDFFWVFN
jgi:hypothetical protein